MNFSDNISPDFKLLTVNFLSNTEYHAIKKESKENNYTCNLLLFFHCFFIIKTSLLLCMVRSSRIIHFQKTYQDFCYFQKDFEVCFLFHIQNFVDDCCV